MTEEKRLLKITVTTAGRLASAECPSDATMNGQLMTTESLNTLIGIYWETTVERTHYDVWVDGFQMDYEIWLGFKLIRGEQ